MDIHALIVDDSGIMRKMVMRSLQESELAMFTFTEASDGLEALEKFDENTMQMIFVDWNMPRMNGLEFVQKIRQQQKNHIPVVMITTEGTIGKIDEATGQVAIDKYISKPFTSKDIKVRLAPLFDELENTQKKPKGFFEKLANK